MKIHEDIFSKLTDEQKKAVEAATSVKELHALAKEAGHELSPEVLDGIAGGACWDCGSDSCKEYTPPGG